MSDIDTTAIQKLQEMLDELDAAGVEVMAARLRQPVRHMLARSGLLDRIRPDAIFLEVDDAVAHYLRERPTDRPAAGDGRDADAEDEHE